MSKTKPTTQLVTCPHCGHRQLEPIEGVSTTCRSCGKYFSLEVNLPKKRKESFVRQEREIQCDLCGHRQRIPIGALSTFCEGCGAYMNVRNYDISGISREKIETFGDVNFDIGCNYRGAHVIGYRVTVRGYVHARITAKKELLIEEGGKVRGSLAAAFLHVLKGGLARSTRIEAKVVEIEGEVEVDDCIVHELRVGKHGQLKARHLIAESLHILSGGTFTGDFSTSNLAHTPFPAPSPFLPQNDLFGLIEE